MSAAPHARLPKAARHWLLDSLIGLVSFAATLLLLLHGLGSDGSVAHHLDAAGVLLAACTSFR